MFAGVTLYPVLFRQAGRVCKAATVRNESRARHLLGNDDHAWVWTFLKVPFAARHSCIKILQAQRLEFLTRLRGTPRYHHMFQDAWFPRCVVKHPDSFRHAHRFPVTLASTSDWSRSARHDGLYHRLTAQLGCAALQFTYTCKPKAMFRP